MENLSGAFDEEQYMDELMVCVYCGKEKGEKISCCGEMHFEELQNTEWRNN